MLVKEELLAKALGAFHFDQAALRIIILVPVEPVGLLGSGPPPQLIVLGAGDLAQGVGDAGQKTVAVVGVLGALLRAVDL